MALLVEEKFWRGETMERRLQKVNQRSCCALRVAARPEGGTRGEVPDGLSGYLHAGGEASVFFGKT